MLRGESEAIEIRLVRILCVVQGSCLHQENFRRLLHFLCPWNVPM